MACNADMIVQSQEGDGYGFLYGGSISIGGGNNKGKQSIYHC